MISKELFTTGEAAALLHISRSTISRNYDKGVLSGQKNPITGERLISRESLVGFMERHRLTPDAVMAPRKKILLGTSDERFLSSLQKLFSQDQRIRIDRVPFGGDVLTQCSRERPHLLIVDQDLPDIPCKEVIKSLRRTEEQNEVKILCGTGQDDPECLEWGADGALAKDQLDENALAKKIYSILEIPPDRTLERQTFEHKRRSPRIRLKLPARIGLYCVGVPYVRESGNAVLENISLSGVFLSQIRLENKILPGKPFRILVEIDHPPLDKWRAHCKVIRLQSNGYLSAGLQFVRVSKPNRRKLETIA